MPPAAGAVSAFWVRGQAVRVKPTQAAGLVGRAEQKALTQVVPLFQAVVEPMAAAAAEGTLWTGVLLDQEAPVRCGSFGGIL